MKILFHIFVLSLLTCSSLFSKGKHSYKNPYPNFKPYVVEQDTTKYTIANVDIKTLGKEQPARWLSVDPMADKYPGWSPYNYTLNNPINYFDPNGDSVWVHWQTGFWSFLGLGTEHKALYDNSKLYENGQEYKGDDSYALSTLGALNEINSGTEGNKILDQIMGSKLSYNISDGDNSFSISGREINWDPSDTQGGVDANGNIERASFIGLAHELAHGYNYDLAVNGKVTWDNSEWFRTEDNKVIPMFEKFACNWENKVRAEHKITLRQYYGIKILGFGRYKGIGPSLLKH